MDIRGMTKFTLIDYPGKLACVIFTGNCNLLCPYCHNSFLVIDPESQPAITEEVFFNFLEKRKNRLNAVVISGGEPTLQKDLIEFSLKIKKKEFLLKLDTNGTNFKIIRELIDKECIDYIGLDYKATLDKYKTVSGRNNNYYLASLKDTIKAAVKFKIPYDIRTTVHKKFLTENDLFKIRSELDEFGINTWTLQQFNPVDVLDEELLNIPTYSDSELINIAKQMKNTYVRGVKN